MLKGNSEKDRIKVSLAKKKKKEKVKKFVGKGLKIVDEDTFSLGYVPPNDSDDEDVEELPQIAAVVDERPIEVQMLESFSQSKWKRLEDNERDMNSTTAGRQSVSSPRRSLRDDDDLSPPRPSHKRRDSDDISPPRVRNRRDSGDMSPPRARRRRDSGDVSPPRARRRRDSGDISPPRARRRRDSGDISPPRARRRRDSGDISPPRARKRRDSGDTSPPRRRRRSGSSDISPPRQKSRQSSPPQRRRKRDSSDDISPPRRNEGRNSSGQRQRRISNDTSPPRRRNTTPPRNTGGRRNERERNLARPEILDASDEDRKSKITLDGKKAGLQKATALRDEMLDFRKRENELFETLPDEVSGRNAKTVIRDRRTEADLAKEREKQMKEEERKKQYAKWGKGLKQVEEQQTRVREAVHEMSKPLARYENDNDLDDHLKNIERDGDPMAEYLASKRRKATGGIEKPRYSGPPPPPNRFNIPPGFRWDGVDRSNGYERQWFNRINAKKAIQEEAYKWSVEDL